MSNHEEIVYVYIYACVYIPRFPYCFLAFPRGSTARRVVIVSLARVRLEPPPHLAFGLAATSRPDRFYTFVSPTLVRRASALTARRSCTRPALLSAAHTTTAERIDLFFSSSPDVCICVYTYICVHAFTVYIHRETRGGDGGSRRKDEAGKGPGENSARRALSGVQSPLSFLGIKARRTIDRRLSRSFFSPLACFTSQTLFVYIIFRMSRSLIGIVDNALNLLKLVKFFEMLFVKLISNFDRFRFFSNLEKLDSRHEDD